MYKVANDSPAFWSAEIPSTAPAPLRESLACLSNWAGRGYRADRPQKTMVCPTHASRAQIAIEFAALFC